jgi:hypothetical protein
MASVIDDAMLQGTSQPLSARGSARTEPSSASFEIVTYVCARHVTTTPQQVAGGNMAQDPVETGGNQETEQAVPKKLPKGVVLGPDGKP